MTALIIILAVLCLIASLFFVNVKIVIKYDDGLYARLCVLGIKFPLYPEAPPKQEMSIKELKKLRKKYKKSKLTRTEKKAEKKKRKFSDIIKLVKEISGIILEFSQKLFKYLKINIKTLDIVVATSDPAKTALTFGVVCSTLNQLIERIEESDIKYKFGDMECRCDYLATTFSCKADIVLKIRVWQIISLLIYSLSKYNNSDLNLGGIKNEQQD